MAVAMVPEDDGLDPKWVKDILKWSVRDQNGHLVMYDRTAGRVVPLHDTTRFTTRYGNLEILSHHTGRRHVFCCIRSCAQDNVVCCAPGCYRTMCHKCAVLHSKLLPLRVPVFCSMLGCSQNRVFCCMLSCSKDVLSCMLGWSQDEVCMVTPKFLLLLLLRMMCSVAFQAAAHEDDVPSGMPCCSQDDVL